MLINLPAIANNTVVSITLSQFFLYCPSLDPQVDILVDTLTGVGIEQGTASIPRSRVTSEAIQITDAGTFTSVFAGHATSFAVQLPLKTRIPSGSEITVSLRMAEALLTSRSCGVFWVQQAGNSPVSGSCSLSGPVNGVTTLKVLTNLQIDGSVDKLAILRIEVANFQLLKRLTSVSSSIQISTSLGCLFSAGTFGSTVSQVSQLTKLESTLVNPVRSVFTPATISITTNMPLWNNGDYFIITSSNGFSPEVSCRTAGSPVTSANCIIESPTSIRATVVVDPAAYSSASTLGLVVSQVRTIPLEGNQTFSAALFTPGLGQALQTSRSASAEVKGSLVMETANINFTSNFRGLSSQSRVSLRVDTLVLNESILQLESPNNKYVFPSNLTLGSTFPDMRIEPNLQQSNVLRLVLLQRVTANSTILVTLNMQNPSTEFVATDDLKLSIFFPTGLELVAQAAPQPNLVNFICDPGCLTCGAFYKTCTSCGANMTVVNQTCALVVTPRQIPLTVKKEDSIPFVCLGVGVIATFLLVVLGGLAKLFTFWWNLLSSLLRFVYFAQLLLLEYYIIKNDESYWLFFWVGIVIIAHLVISIFGSILSRRAVNRAVYGPQMTSNKIINNFLQNLADKKGSQGPQSPSCWLRFCLLVSALIGSSLMRCFFSSTKQHKGHFWYFDTPSFDNVKSTLQRVHMLYVFLVQIGLVVIVSLSFGQSIYYFKIEALAVTALDLLVYCGAYFEVNPWTKSFSVENQSLRKSAQDNSLLLPADQSGVMGDTTPPKDKSLNGLFMIDEEPELGDQAAPQKTRGTPSKPRGYGLISSNRMSDSEQTLRSQDVELNQLNPNDHRHPGISTPLSLFCEEITQEQAQSTRNVGSIGQDAEGNRVMGTNRCNLSGMDSNLAKSTHDMRTSRKQMWAQPKHKIHQSKELEVILEQEEPDTTLSVVTLLPAPKKYRESPKKQLEQVKEDYLRKRNLKKNVVVTEADLPGDMLPTDATENLFSGLESPYSLRVANPALVNNFIDIQITDKDSVSGKRIGPSCKINGQNHSDLVSGCVRDAQGVCLYVDENKNIKGLFKDEAGHMVYMEYNELDDLRKGLFQTHSRNKIRVADQDFELMEREGKVVDYDRQVVEIFGQRAFDISKGKLYLNDGSFILLENQKQALLQSGIILKPDGAFISVKYPQKQELLNQGIVLDSKGNRKRLIDQTIVGLKAGEVKGYQCWQEFKLKAPKRRNKADAQAASGEDEPFRGRFFGKSVPIKATGSRVHSVVHDSSIKTSFLQREPKDRPDLHLPSPATRTRPQAEKTDLLFFPSGVIHATPQQQIAAQEATETSQIPVDIATEPHINRPDLLATGQTGSLTLQPDFAEDDRAKQPLLSIVDHKQNGMSGSQFGLKFSGLSSSGQDLYRQQTSRVPSDLMPGVASDRVREAISRGSDYLDKHNGNWRPPTAGRSQRQPESSTERKRVNSARQGTSSHSPSVDKLKKIYIDGSSNILPRHRDGQKETLGAHRQRQTPALRVDLTANRRSETITC